MSDKAIRAFLRAHHHHLDPVTYGEVQAARLVYLGADETLRLSFEEAFAAP